jgi:MFS family permease
VNVDSEDRSASAGATPAEFRRHWDTITLAGLFGTIYYLTCVYGAPRTRFLVELEATPFDFGLMAGLGALAFALQLVSGWLTNRLRVRKHVWIGLTIAHRLAMLGVLATPLLFLGERARVWWIMGVTLLHNCLAQVGEPIWSSWMTDLVPREAMNHHWAVRQRLITAGSVLVEIGVAFGFSWFEHTGRIFTGYAVLGLVGVALGVLDVCLFFGVPEPVHERVHGISMWQALAEPLADRAYRRFLEFRTYWNFAMMVAAPFFQLYLIGEMKLSVLTVQLLGAVSSLGIVLSSRFWGHLCDQYGFRPALQLVVGTKFLVPLTYLLVPPVRSVAIPIFVILFFADGVMNAGAVLAFRGVTMKQTPRRNRAMYIAAANFVALGLAGGLAPLISGALIRPLTRLFSFTAGPYQVTGFHAIFLIGVLLRLGGLPLVNRLQEPGGQPLSLVLARIRSRWSRPTLRQHPGARPH